MKPHTLILWGVFFSVLFGSLSVYGLHSVGARSADVQKRTHHAPGEDYPTVLFTGDIMLGRGVEDRIEAHGVPWLFKHIAPYIVDADIAVGNFEATVPTKHISTPDFTFAFSVRSPYMSKLSDIGFDVLSLANNHALDHGTNAFVHTLKVCSEAGMICIGDPRHGAEIKGRVMKVDGVRIAFVGVTALAPLPEDGTLARLMDSLSHVSDVQIVYIHWGDEYTPKPRVQDRKLAHALIDFGADAIIGHHSHVIGAYEEYRGAPIYYSLGNLIFDQYFSSEVQEGIMLSLTITEDAYVYEVIPYESYTVRSQPRTLDAQGRERVFAALFGERDEYTETRTTGVRILPR